MEIDKASQPEKPAKPSVSINICPEKRIKQWHFRLTLKGCSMFCITLSQKLGDT